MLLKWCFCVILVAVVVNVDRIHCIFSSRSSSSGSRGFSSGSRSSSFGSGSRSSSFGSGSRSTSFGSGSRGSSSSGSSGSTYGFHASGSYGNSFGSGSRGLSSSGSSFGSAGTYGWKVTSRPVVSNPVTSRFQNKPPPFNPSYNSGSSSRFATTKSPLLSSAGSRFATTKQPAYNPFFTSASKPVTSRFQDKPAPFNPSHNSGSSSRFATTKSPLLNSAGSRFATTKQPPFNPFFTSGSRLGTTRQPAYNPFFTAPNKATTRFGQPTSSPSLNKSFQRNNGTSFNNFGRPNSGSVFNSSSHKNTGSNFNPFGNGPSRSRFNNSVGVNTQRPFYQTTKFTPLGNGNNFGRPAQPWRPHNSSINNSGNIHRPYTTSRPLYQGPSWNASSFNRGPSTRQYAQGGMYQPPTSYRNTYMTATGAHPHYPVQPIVHPIQTRPSTTIINNNNHYYGGSSYYRPGYYTPLGSGSTHVTIINNNNYQHHQVIVPSRHYYSYGPPAIGVTVVNTQSFDPFATTHYHTTYHYSTYDTGSTSLGFFLGYQLGRINRPSYYYHSTTYVNNEYIPRYDHYTVHHYYHNRDDVPREAPIQPNAIVVCPGDSASLCPPGNMPLCTNNGAVMCVVNAVNTSPCTNNRQTNCVTSTIPCEGNSSPDCNKKQSTSVSIPCISTANIPAGVGFVNNSIIVTDANDSSVKSFCVTVLAIPTKNETNVNKNEPHQNSLQESLSSQYTTNDTGVDMLGYYLGEKLQNLAQPSYSYLNYDENYNYVERFDHYSIFQYYHNSDVLPKEVDIKADQIVNCIGDSGSFCPQPSLSLCLNDGAVICVTDYSSIAYSDKLQTNYFNSTISCNNLKSPYCQRNPNTEVPVQIPCFSTAKVYANITNMERTFGLGRDLQRYRTFELFNNTANATVQNVTIARELCVSILLLPGEKIYIEIPKAVQITGIPNAPNSLNLPKYTYTSANIFKYRPTKLGLYLKYILSKLSFPSYYYVNAYLYSQNGTVQMYDHYSVHYDKYGKEIIPDNLEFQAFDLRACEGDSGLVCPKNTSAICVNDGGVMCLTDMLLTQRCQNDNTTFCVKTRVTCEDGRSCSSISNVKNISVPCISTATIYGDIMAVKHNIYERYPSLAGEYIDIQPIPGTNVNNTPTYHKAQQFCVTVVVLPEVRKISEGEKLLVSANNMIGRIMYNIFR